MNAEGGSSNFAFSTRASHSELGQALRLVRGGRRPRTDFFLRADSLFTAATYLEGLPDDSLASYGGVSLHEQYHGESFLAVMIDRFGPGGFYLLDEAEAALSTQNCLTLLRRVHELVNEDSQFIIATHSPLVLAYPRATIYSCQPGGVELPWPSVCWLCRRRMRAVYVSRFAPGPRGCVPPMLIALRAWSGRW